MINIKDTRAISFDTVFAAAQARRRLGQIIEAMPARNAFDGAIIQQAFEQRLSSTQAFIVPPAPGHGWFLFLPAGPSTLPDERRYVVATYGGGGDLRAYEFDHIPLPEDFYTDRQKRRGINRMAQISLEQRAVMTAKNWRSLRGLTNKSQIQNMAYLLHDEGIAELGLRDRQAWIERYVPSHPQNDVERAFETASRSGPGNPAMSAAGEFASFLRDIDIQALKPAINHLAAVMDGGALGVLKGIPGHETTTMYNFLCPHRQLREKKEDVGKDGHRRRIVSRSHVLEVKTAEARRDFFSRFRVAASFIRDPFKAMPLLALGLDGDSVSVMRKMCAGPLSDDVMNFMESVREPDMGMKSAARANELFFYLNFVDKNAYPDTPRAWSAFSEIVDFDKTLAAARFRRRGQTLSEITTSGSGPTDWRALTKDVQFAQTARQILTMANRIGLSCLAPLALNMRNNLGATIDDHEIVRLCSQDAPRNIHGLSEPAKNVICTWSLALYGQILAHVPINTLIHYARHFDRTLSEWDHFKRRFAITDAFNRRAEDQKWLALPTPSLDLTSAGDLSHFMIEPLGNAADCANAMTEMNRRDAFRRLWDVAHEPLHLFTIRQNYNGKLAALFILTEQQPDDSILSLQKAGHYLHADNAGSLSNSAQDAADEYIRWLNDKRLPAKPFREAREALRLRAERRSGLQGMIGHNPFDAQQNRQVIEILFAVLPPALRQAGPWGCIAERTLYQSLTEVIYLLDPAVAPKMSVLTPKPVPAQPSLRVN